MPGVAWTLFIRATDPREAAWVKSVRPLVVRDADLDDLKTRSTAGVLLASVGRQMFAVTFGHGFQALEPGFVVRGFGLKVTANIVASDRVTSADTRGLSRSSRSQKTVLPAASEFAELGIEPSDEWVRQLGGKVSATDFAATAEGADSLKLGIRDFTLTGLPSKLREIARLHRSDSYKRDFGFLDNFIRLDRRDELVNELDNMVEEMLLAGSEELGFAAPDPFEQKRVDYFVMKYRKEVAVEELTIENVYGALVEFTLPAGLMHKVSVFAYDDEGNPVDKRYTLYDYVQAEVTRGGDRYVLTSGVWFRIAASYLEYVNEYVKSIEDLTTELQLPDWDRDELDKSDDDDTIEGAYNVKVAREHKYELLDKKNLYFGPNQKIEICDLLTSDRDLLCVKRASKSSNLSHLFAQGSVSASLMNEPKYRSRIMEHLRRLDRGAGYGNPADWTFVYAIATDKQGSLADSLFFFSKVNLVTHVREIKSRSFGVAVAKIRVV
jgi:uncharacterized protein (TIGR04141 family)